MGAQDAKVGFQTFFQACKGPLGKEEEEKEEACSGSRCVRKLSEQFPGKKKPTDGGEMHFLGLLLLQHFRAKTFRCRLSLFRDKIERWSRKRKEGEKMADGWMRE